MSFEERSSLKKQLDNYWLKVEESGESTKVQIESLRAQYEERILVDWTTDLSLFRALAPGALRFVRFRVDLEAEAGAPAAPDLRVPRRF